MGLFDFFKDSSDKLGIDLSDMKFISNDHIRYENGRDVSGHNKDCWRGFRIQTNISGGQSYTVTLYNLDGNNPIWGNNIQMAPKQMKIIEQNSTAIKLRGYGTDRMGASFADYGLTLHLTNDNVEKVTLHMYDRNIDIVYFKAVEQAKESTHSLNNDLEAFRRFIGIWNNEMPMNKKLEIAATTDALNNKGVDAYEEGDIDLAISYYEQALLVMSNNDDALKNLRICYSKKNNQVKVFEITQKLAYLGI